MKVILVATDNRGKNLVFVSDALRVYLLAEAVRLAQDGKLENIYPVHRGTGVYLRTKPRVPVKEQLDAVSVSSYRLFSSPNDLRRAISTPVFGNYWALYQAELKDEEGPFIVIDGYALITKEWARKKLQPHKDLVTAGATRFSVDPFLLGAIIIDEIARFAPWGYSPIPWEGILSG